MLMEEEENFMLMSGDTNILNFMKYPGVYFVKGDELKTSIFESLQHLYFLEGLNECKFSVSPEKVIDNVIEYATLVKSTKYRELSLIDASETIPTKYESFDGYNQEEIDLYRTIGCGIVHASHGKGIVSIIFIDDYAERPYRMDSRVDLNERTMGLVSKYDSDVIKSSINSIKHVQTSEVKKVGHKFKKYIPAIDSIIKPTYEKSDFERAIQEEKDNKTTYLITSETTNLLGNSFKCSSTSLHCPSISNRCIERLRVGA